MNKSFFQDALVLFVILLVLLVILGSSFALFWYFQKKLISLHQTIILKQNETEIDTKQNIAYILHEEVAKSLTFVQWNTNRVRKVLEEKEDSDADLMEALDYCDAIDNYTSEAKEKVTTLHQTLYPPSLLVLEFQEACAELVKKLQAEYTGKIDFHHEGTFSELDKTILFNLYGLVNLFVTNSIRHSESTMIQVNLEHINKKLCLVIQDNGIGFDMAEAQQNAKGRGVFDIKSRAIALFPSYFNFMSEKGKGTTLRIELHTN